MHPIEIMISQVNIDVWLRQYLREQYETRDFIGMTGARGVAPNVKGTHPFVQVFAGILKDGQNFQFQGIFPAISVTRGKQTESHFRIGGGDKSETVFEREFFSQITAYGNNQSRIREGVYMSDKQFDAIKSRMDALPENAKGLITQRTSYFEKELANISIWTDNYEESQVLEKLTKSILHDARRVLSGSEYEMQGLSMENDPDLMNGDFAKVLYGTEIQLQFEKNEHVNLSITDQIAVDTEYDITLDVKYKTTGD
jgi:hypothetical protein